MTASGRKPNVEALLTAKACVVGVSPTGTQMRIAGSCGLCWSEGIARPSLATSPPSIYVWMRDVLCTSDHLKGFGQATGIERRVVTAIGAVGGRAQALTHDHVR